MNTREWAKTFIKEHNIPVGTDIDIEEYIKMSESKIKKNKKYWKNEAKFWKEESSRWEWLARVTEKNAKEGDLYWKEKVLKIETERDHFKDEFDALKTKESK